MNPIELTRDLQASLVSYLKTTFDVNRDGSEAVLADSIEASFQMPGGLFNGPYLEITPPYQTGKTLRDLVNEDVLTRRLIDLSCFREGKPIPVDAPLYLHQEQAIYKLCVENRSVVISSGTGSGKTECFLIPILNDLLMDSTPGVRALLIYPMNALVNDQLDRLRSLLKGTSITFGRYTSELAETRKAALETNRNPLPNEVISREEIRSGEKIPQILITNYAMLEYLLLRPEDSVLFQNGTWRYIILDEAHTYAGAQGIEVAFLLRRLKHRLQRQPGETLCVATSATLTNDDNNKAAEFASELFDERFTADEIIFGLSEDLRLFETQGVIYTADDFFIKPEFKELLGILRQDELPEISDLALMLDYLGLISEEELQAAPSFGGTAYQFLCEVLSRNSKLRELREWMLLRSDHPATPQETAAAIFPNLDEDARLEAIYNLTELGFLAREAPDKPSLLPARYHLFARPPKGIWVCLNAQCAGKQTSSDEHWSKIFSIKREKCDSCGCAVYQLSICRACGQPYLLTFKEERHFLTEPTDPTNPGEKHYFTWKPLFQKTELYDDSENFEIIEDSVELNQAANAHEEFVLCVHCRCKQGNCQCEQPSYVNLYLMREEQKQKKGQQTLTKTVPITHMNQCCRCHSSALKDSEIVTPISLAGMSPLSVLTHELYRRLPSSSHASHNQSDGRKLLSFYDSRQGAARFAAFLQDVVNEQIYRHIIPTAVRELEAKKGLFPDLEMLADRCVKIALETEIFHNDPAFNIRRGSKPTQSERERLNQAILTRLLAEFTTQRRERQSLENLGLVAVEYFEAEDELHLTSLASQIGISEGQTRILIEYLLDDLRKDKVVTLPEGVAADDRVFGRNKFSPRVVRGQARQYEVAWIGETERHSRRMRVQSILQHQRMPADAQNVQRVLGEIWDWLTTSDIFYGTAQDGYQIDYPRLFFRANASWYQCRKCQRLHHRGNDLPCPNVRCLGEMRPVEIEALQHENFYYQALHRPLIPLRVEEHTAQLDSHKGRDYQDQFRDGLINILSCSTTFEMGIDLGDLQAVVMSTVPPTVANYRQRAGRAGRRSSSAAFILTWASERPHDQTYFRSPNEIIRGHMRVPHLDIDNPYILRRHINAILLSAYLKYRRDARYEGLSKVGDFFDEQGNQSPHFAGIEDWLTRRDAEIYESIERFAAFLPSKDNLAQRIQGFFNELRQIKSDHYDLIAAYYRQGIDTLAIAQGIMKSYEEPQQAREDSEHLDKLLKRLNEESLINYLSDKGFLPSYSFPLYTVELLLPPNKGSDHLRLQRDLRQAIREYAPGSEVVADKRIWRSDGLIFYRDTPIKQEYRICEHCNNLQIAKPGQSLPDSAECPICKQLPSRRPARPLKFVTPDGFRADFRSGQPARQYVNTPFSAMRSALIPPRIEDEKQLGTLIRYAYDHDGQLLYVNEGEYSRRFKICMKCGKLTNRDGKCTGRYKGQKCTGGQVEDVALGHLQTTDTLHLRFESSVYFTIPAADQQSFWLSLMYALLQGASHALQIERRDIDGVLLPISQGNYGWEQSVVLYDNVPGGAGHVKRIHDNFSQVIREALNIVNCLDCAPETSCYHCLRDYGNQVYHQFLSRGEVIRFLEVIHHDLAPFANQEFMGEAHVIAANLPYWLMQQLSYAHSSVLLAVEHLSLDSPAASDQMWLDVIGDLVRRQVKVDLFVQDLGGDDGNSMSIKASLQILMDRGLNVWEIDQLPSWQVIIDQGTQSQRAVRIPEGHSFILDASLSGNELLSTIHPDGVQKAFATFEAIRTRQVSKTQLNPPSNIEVINVKPHTHRNQAEQNFFGKVFAQPVLEMHVNDPYLQTYEQIVNRLGAYIELAAQHDSFEKVTVTTKRAGEAGLYSDKATQDRAIKALEKEFSNVKIIFKYAHPDHDRFIEIHRANGTQAHILIGRGLDFIGPKGDIMSTYIVIQDPF